MNSIINNIPLFPYCKLFPQSFKTKHLVQRLPLKGICCWQRRARRGVKHHCSLRRPGRVQLLLTGIKRLRFLSSHQFCRMLSFQILLHVPPFMGWPMSSASTVAGLSPRTATRAPYPLRVLCPSALPTLSPRRGTEEGKEA